MHIKLPYSEQSGHIPSADRLKVGELWINGADNIIGTKKQNEQVVQFAQLTPEQRERVLNDYIPKHGVVDKVSVGQTATKIEGKNDAVTIDINDDSDTAIEYTVTNSALTINIEKTTGHKATKLVISKPANQPVVITWNGVDHWLSTAGVPAFGESVELEELCVAIFTSSTINCVNVIYNTEAVGSTDDAAVWGMIGGTLSDQEDLQAALNSKLSVNVAAETYLKKTDKAERAKVADTVVGKNVTGVVAEATKAATASKAAALTTARTIAIGGAVTGTATSFNGTANITINTTAVNGAKVTGTVPAATKATQDGTGKVIATTYATKTEVTQGLAGKANISHTHTVSQITDMPKVVLKVNNIAPASGGNVNLGLHAVATSGDYNDLRNKPRLPSTPSAYITETWKSTDGASWYRKWSDGWIEQGGNYKTNSIYNASITLTVPMKTTKYYCNAISEFTSEYKDNSFIYIMDKTTTGFYLGALTSYGTWEVRGY